MRNKKNSEGLTLMEWACAAGAYAAWLAGEDPTEWRNARASDEAIMAKKRASLEQLVGGPLEEDVREFTGVHRRTPWLPRLPVEPRRGFCSTSRNDLDVCTITDSTATTDKGFLVYDDATTAVEPDAPVDDIVGGKIGFRCWEHILSDADSRKSRTMRTEGAGFTPPTVGAYTLGLTEEDNTVGRVQDSNFPVQAASLTDDSNPIPKFGEVWISKDRRRANYFTVRSVNLKDEEVHTSDHRTIKLSRMSRYRKLK